MTYLEIVNEVLALMRLDPVSTTVGVDDEAAKVVIKFVNSAKEKCEKAWRWNALYFEEPITLSTGINEYEIPQSDTYVVLDEVFNTTRQYWLVKSTAKNFKTKDTTTQSFPLEWAVAGVGATKDVKLRLWPTPQEENDIEVMGWRGQPRLESDDDELLIPSMPVIYETLALALRERGEVGGQTALEVFAIAKQHLADAIALDSSQDEYETLWRAV